MTKRTSANTIERFDPVGKQFGKWFVIAHSHTTRSATYWLCRDDKGSERVVHQQLLKRSPERQAWFSMRRRCNTKHNPDYPYYGGRGITVCDHWSSFENFLADVGPRPSPRHSIDRIDPNGNYEPSNVRWATAVEQRMNQRLSTPRVLRVLDKFEAEAPELIKRIRAEITGLPP